MFYYVYRIKNDLKNKLECIDVLSLNNSHSKLIFNNHFHNIINGLVNLENDALVNSSINFEIDLESLFLFIETDHQAILNKCLNVIESFLKDNLSSALENFLPRVSKEHELICNSHDFNLKFFYDGKIIDCENDEKIEEKYCKSELPQDFILVEADIELEKNVSFSYYRRCLSIPDETSKEYILDRFKQVMA